ncbi:MAG: peroxide stress protein YaaA [Flavobacteriales bacterium]|nr:peroxide stress protein YaaA [Flavobacteriales bacterium]MBK7268933.1 peroxide stress protein YaaA [Flavobacteriales bacterium]MBK7752240.1 peroxide stress protein YaaA [Flavobacteriales bacterium]MBK9074277.1 peroxide stress protein YaaA [Flavobacteriales bacterium]
MIVLLSPAKDLAKETPTVASTTQPVLLEHTKPLVAKLKTLSAKKLSSLMDLSPKLGELNRERYEKWKPPFTSQNARPAVFTFNGEVYRGLEARTLSSSDLAFAQHHLRILSGLYGVLRPLDLMQDYRLMMGTPFGVGRTKDLYAYWSDRITELLKKDLKAAGGSAVINLASSEYFKVVNVEKLAARVITPVFKDKGPRGYGVVMVFAKQQRGAMARHIIQHRLLEPEKIKAYTGDGYKFAPEESTAEEWVFLRDKKPLRAPAKLLGGRIR